MNRTPRTDKLKHSSLILPAVRRSPRERREMAFQSADLVCFSHLRWDFVFQRPQHLLSRFSRHRRVFFWEEPVTGEGAAADLSIRRAEDRLWILTPRLPTGIREPERALRDLLDAFLAERNVSRPLLWYYTPMALAFSDHLDCLATVYDCMDELSHFKGAPEGLRERERELLDQADVVFTGGQSLFEAKRSLHPNIHPVPSSVDVAHFRRARQVSADPPDQASIGRPRVGFFGVLDERLDAALLDAAARLRPEWHFVLLGPVVKIDPAQLPRRANLHYLGGKRYEELPSYLAGWDVAMLPFARNDATRFISPTKTPEYLAAGKPVVSTSIRDVVHPYGDKGLVEIADEPERFVAAVERCLATGSRPDWRGRVDRFLSDMSWDLTWERMNRLVREATLAPALGNGA